MQPEDVQNLSPQQFIRLQRTIGNRAISRFAAASVQPKLTVGAAGDSYEQEADRVADRVLTMPTAASVRVSGPGGGVHRQGEEEEVQTKPLAAGITPLSVRRQEDEEEIQTQRLQRQEDEEEVQTKPANPLGSFETDAGWEQRLAGTRGDGDPLTGDVRSYMEPRFGADFGGVRIHTGGEPARLSREIGAQAFTQGQDIYFGEGKYAPETTNGKRLLAHELAHTVQQNGVHRRTFIRRHIDTRAVIEQEGGAPSRRAIAARSSYWKLLNQVDKFHSANKPSEKHDSLKHMNMLADSWLQNHPGTAENANVPRRSALLRLRRESGAELEKYASMGPQGRQALFHAGEQAATASKNATGDLKTAWRKLGFSSSQLTQLRDYFRNHAEVTINVEPEKQVSGEDLIEKFKKADKYKNTFELGGLSGGSATGIGGGRDAVEQKLFGFQKFSATPGMEEFAQRPKYAAINMMGYSTGAATNSGYGNSVLVLKQDVKQRSTVTHKDSFGGIEKKDIGTFDNFDHVLLGLINARIHHTRRGEDNGEAVAYFTKILAMASRGQRPADRNTEMYVEAHVFGAIDYKRDVQELRGDFHQCFGNSSGQGVIEWAAKLGVPLKWVFNPNEAPVDHPRDGTKKAAFDTWWQRVAASGGNREKEVRAAWADLKNRLA